ncbi:MAG: hypothetical protein JST80_04605 [Bdellovibrionales bacterium]|nr:hypothetical protein [Bdellovibrionales bacterium]
MQLQHPKSKEVGREDETLEQVNHPENILFGFLGALCAAIIGLSLYQREIQEKINVNRAPGSEDPVAALITPVTTPVKQEQKTSEDFEPLEYLPFLY